MTPILLTFYADANCQRPDPAGLYFRGSKNAEEVDTSSVVNQAFVRYGARWGNGKTGGATFRVVASGSASRPLGENDPNVDYFPLPPGVRFVTVEGRREHPGVIPAVDLLQQAL